MNQGKVVSGFVALGIYLGLIFLVLYFYNIHKIKAQKFADKPSDRVTVTLVNSDKTVFNKSAKKSNNIKPIPIPIPLKRAKSVPKKHIPKKIVKRKHIPKKVIPKKHIPKKIVPPKKVIPKKHIPKKIVPPKKVIPKKHIPKKIVPPKKVVPKKHIPKKIVPPKKVIPKKHIPKKHIPKKIVPPKKVVPKKHIPKKIVPPKKVIPKKHIPKKIVPPKKVVPKKHIPKKIVPPKKVIPKKHIPKKIVPPKKSAKDLFSSIKTKDVAKRPIKREPKPVKRPVVVPKEPSRVKHNSSISDRIKNTHQSGRVSTANRDTGIKNAYISKVKRQMNNWDAGSAHKGKHVSLSLTIYNSGKFSYRILSGGNVDMKNSLSKFLDRLNSMGQLGRHSKSTPYTIKVKFTVR